MKALDLPPVWLVFVAVLAALLDRFAPLPRFSGETSTMIGYALVGLSLALAFWAVAVMAQAKTTVMPHQQPEALVVAGPFRFTRNPIYLADLGILIGFGFWLGSPWPIVLTPLLLLILDRRFIRLEEAKLRQKFGPAFDEYASAVRRWI